MSILGINVGAKTIDLCSNCSNVTNCVFAVNRPISSCEEHKISEEKHKTFGQMEENSTFTAFLGLCSDCDNAKDCSLKEKQVIVINCEQYK